jgi:hypothetical protein
MTTKGLTTDEEANYQRQLDFYLRSTGKLFPVTPAQVAAFEEYMQQHPELEAPETDLTPEEVLRRGYVDYIPKQVSPQDENPWSEGMKAAARNAGEMDEETLKKMRRDEGI